MRAIYLGDIDITQVAREAEVLAIYVVERASTRDRSKDKQDADAQRLEGMLPNML